ncbi:hypothetical protein BC830DRAFT_1086174 [Chytriomyces sp. MP71]|nr:hypothetical protein BC830DRAFT_1086174 [Chytriomyces sp. MP71]
MAFDSKRCGGCLSNEEAAAIWNPLIANQQACQEYHHSVVEKRKSGIFQATPQRSNANLDYDEQAVPVMINPECLDDVVAFARKINVKNAIDQFGALNIETPNEGPRLAGPKKRVPGSSKQEFGATGNWEQNSALKLTFDRIVPGAKGGSYDLKVLIGVNTAKWDHSQAEAKEWISGYKQVIA